MPIVPISVKVPVVALMLYIEMLSEPQFATYANLPEGSMATDMGTSPASIVPMEANSPVEALIMYIDTPPLT